MEAEADIDKIDLEEDFVGDIVEKVIDNPELLPTILEGVYSEIMMVRFNSAKTLVIISRKNPEILYPHMDFFIKLLDNDSKIVMCDAIDIIANLSAVDSAGFNEIFEKFYEVMFNGSLVTAGQVIGNSWKIANARPELQKKITGKLLGLEKAPMDEECRNVLLGKAILSFDKYFDEIQNKEEVISLVKRQLNNKRNATKVKAERFLKKHPN